MARLWVNFYAVKYNIHPFLRLSEDRRHSVALWDTFLCFDTRGATTNGFVTLTQNQLIIRSHTKNNPNARPKDLSMPLDLFPPHNQIAKRSVLLPTSKILYRDHNPTEINPNKPSNRTALIAGTSYLPMFDVRTITITLCATPIRISTNRMFPKL